MKALNTNLAVVAMLFCGCDSFAEHSTDSAANSSVQETQEPKDDKVSEQQIAATPIEPAPVPKPPKLKDRDDARSEIESRIDVALGGPPKVQGLIGFPVATPMDFSFSHVRDIQIGRVTPLRDEAGDLVPEAFKVSLDFTYVNNPKMSERASPPGHHSAVVTIRYVNGTWKFDPRREP